MPKSGAVVKRRSDRNLKRKSENDGEQDKVQTRNCDKAGCLLYAPNCCLNASESCTRASYTSRWYHMSLLEHFCNNCFDHYYRAAKEGYKDFNKWQHEWSSVSRASKPNFKCFVANQLLPYWVQCTMCKKWRMVRDSNTLNTLYMEHFECSVAKTSCDDAEDPDVAELKYFKATWMRQVAEVPLLKNSPAGPYLKRFLAEDVGHCPTACTETVLESVPFIEPFHEQQCGESAVWAEPYQMSKDEIEFVKTTLTPATYLGLRNLMIAVWNLLPKQWLTVENCAKYIVCRGMTRILLHLEAEKIVEFLTIKGVINNGVIERPIGCGVINSNCKVIIIGAGISGLVAGRHLKNLGFDVTLLESRAKPGGRVNTSVLHNSAIIRGIINNPFITVAMQLGMPIRQLSEYGAIMEEDGEIIPAKTVKKIDNHFKGIIHGALEFATEMKKDQSWYEVITCHQNDLKEIVGFRTTDDSIFDFLLHFSEIIYGFSLKDVSLLNWEFATGLIGGDAVIEGNFKKITEKLAENLDIQYNVNVTGINYENEVKIISSSEEFSAPKVLVTVPLSVLRNDIKFNPQLPKNKIQALEELGDAFCDVIVMEFTKKFWSCKLKEDCTKFAILSSFPFQLFIDITGTSRSSTPTLMTFIPACTREKYSDVTDERLVSICLSLLKRVFPEQKVPSPRNSFVSRSRDETHRDCYSNYVKVHGSLLAFDEMAEDIEGKVYFAGTGTFRNCPGSLTGAYLSGLREAGKIAMSYEKL